MSYLAYEYYKVLVKKLAEPNITQSMTDFEVWQEHVRALTQLTDKKQYGNLLLWVTNYTTCAGYMDDENDTLYMRMEKFVRARNNNFYGLLMDYCVNNISRNTITLDLEDVIKKIGGAHCVSIGVLLDVIEESQIMRTCDTDGGYGFDNVELADNFVKIKM
jgi:hypothetical protein